MRFEKQNLLEIHDGVCNSDTRYIYKLLRVSAGILPEEMGKLVGVTKQTILSYERNPEKMPDNMVLLYYYIFATLDATNRSFYYIKGRAPEIFQLYNNGHSDIIRELISICEVYGNEGKSFKCAQMLSKVIDAYFANETDTITEP